MLDRASQRYRALTIALPGPRHEFHAALAPPRVRRTMP